MNRRTDSRDNLINEFVQSKDSTKIVASGKYFQSRNFSQERLILKDLQYEIVINLELGNIILGNLNFFITINIELMEFPGNRNDFAYCQKQKEMIFLILQ